MTFSQETGAKFADLVIRRNGLLDQSLDSYLRRASVMLPDTKTYYVLARELRLADLSKVSVRSVWINECTTAYLIGYGDEIVEVMTHRAFTRTFPKRWMVRAEAPFDGGRDGERFHSAMRHKWPKQVGGGLMRGPQAPRTKKLPIIDTRSVRPMKGQ